VAQGGSVPITGIGALPLRGGVTLEAPAPLGWVAQPATTTTDAAAIAIMALYILISFQLRHSG
jgi:hypothetical protein